MSFWPQDTGTATYGTAEKQDTEARLGSHLPRAHWLEIHIPSSYPPVNPQPPCNTSVWQLCILSHSGAYRVKALGKCWKWERMFFSADGYRGAGTSAESDMNIISWSSKLSLGMLLTGKHLALKRIHQTSCNTPWGFPTFFRRISYCSDLPTVWYSEY